MKTVCSFCNAVIHEGESPDDPVSHGICKSCFTRIMTSHGFNARKFLNLFDAPVFLVDDDVNVLAANRLALSLAQKPLETVKGNLCGDVLECINAFLDGGCGKTRFCPDCTFRASVNETYTTGHPVTNRPAILCRKAGETEEKISMLVSTRKDGDIVLLRLQPAHAR